MSIFTDRPRGRDGNRLRRAYERLPTRQAFPRVQSKSPLRPCAAAVRNEVAYIEIFRIAFIQEFERDPINTTRITQAIRAVASPLNYDMSAVGQMASDLFAVLWRRDRIHVAGKNQHRRV